MNCLLFVSAAIIYAFDLGNSAKQKRSCRQAFTVVKFSQKPTVESSVDNVYNQQFLDVALGHIQATFDGALAFVTVDVDRRRLESLRRHVLPGKMLRTRMGLA